MLCALCKTEMDLIGRNPDDGSTWVCKNCAWTYQAQAEQSLELARQKIRQLERTAYKWLAEKLTPDFLKEPVIVKGREAADQMLEALKDVGDVKRYKKAMNYHCRELYRMCSYWRDCFSNGREFSIEGFRRPDSGEGQTSDRGDSDTGCEHLSEWGQARN